MYGEVGELRIVGVPDAVVFARSKPKWLIELKTTRGDYTRLWKDQLIQARIYGLLLDRMAFDCSSLQVVLVRMRQDRSADPDKKRRMLGMIRLALEKGKTGEFEAKLPMKFFINQHDIRAAKRACVRSVAVCKDKKKRLSILHEGPDFLVSR